MRVSCVIIESRSPSYELRLFDHNSIIPVSGISFVTTSTSFPLEEDPFAVQIETTKVSTFIPTIFSMIYPAMRAVPRHYLSVCRPCVPGELCSFRISHAPTGPGDSSPAPAHTPQPSAHPLSYRPVFTSTLIGLVQPPQINMVGKRGEAQLRMYPRKFRYPFLFR